MKISILWFLSKMIDLFSTNLVLRSGGTELNPLFNENKYLTFYFIYLFTFVIYFADKFLGECVFVKDCLCILVIMSFIVPIYNIALTLLP